MRLAQKSNALHDEHHVLRPAKDPKGGLFICISLMSPLIQLGSPPLNYGDNWDSSTCNLVLPVRCSGSEFQVANKRNGIQISR